MINRNLLSAVYRTHEKEIMNQVDLCDANGKLLHDSVGWSRYPMIRCNVTGHPLRKKKWNYWCVTNAKCLFSVTISNLDYAAAMFMYVLDLDTLEFEEQTVVVPFGRGCDMPDEVNASVQFAGKQMQIVFHYESGITTIRVRCENFGGKLLTAELEIHCPSDHETLNVVVPWNANRFQFTSKQNCLRTNGKLMWGDREYLFDPSDSFACLDYGRGVWKYKSTWNWGSASGMQQGRLIGITFGGRWTDGTGVTENGIVVEGKLSKLGEDMVWKYNPSDYMKPWLLETSKTDRVSLKFVPFYERIAKTKAVIIDSEVHQMIGRYYGYVVTDEDEKLEIDGLVGWAEDHRARW
ncbi:DUF2804 domain-containing protein [Paenibacillus albiflavus]|nr:DUF2804 domain-containing protein [Paenibacillus albiflavus]